MSLVAARLSKRTIPHGSACSWCELESDPLALEYANGEIVCCRCRLTALGESTVQHHHYAGQNNHETTFPVDVNDHARLSALQNLWPQSTLRNRDRSPIVRYAAIARGVADMLELGILDAAGLGCLIDDLRDVAESAETLDLHLSVADRGAILAADRAGGSA
jgi:hypothetical protein